MKRIIASIVLAALASTVQSKEMTNESFNKLLRPAMIYAYVHSKYDKPDELPGVALVDKTAIEQVVQCRGSCDSMVAAFYDFNTNIVYVDKRAKNLKPEYALSLIIHEFVHFLQFRYKEYEETCFIRNMLETEANAVQNGFLAARGLNVAPKSINMACPTE